MLRSWERDGVGEQDMMNTPQVVGNNLPRLYPVLSSMISPCGDVLALVVGLMFGGGKKMRNLDAFFSGRTYLFANTTRSIC